MSQRHWIGVTVVIAIVAVVAFQAGTRSGGRAATSAAAEEVAANPEPASTPETSLESPAGTPPAAVPLPAESVADILRLPDFTGTYATYALAAQADEPGVLALIGDAQQVARRNDRLGLTAIFISRYGEIDPKRALDYVVQSDLEMKPNLVFRVVSAWSKADLAAAIDAVGGLRLADLKRAGSDAILAAHADADQAVLADIRARLSAPSVGAAPSPQAVLAMASKDPAAALTEASKLGGQERMATAFGVGNLWAKSDPEAAFARSSTISDPAILEAFRGGLFGAWMESDPARVLRLLDQNASEGERAAILNAGVVRLAQRDPRGAFREVRAVEDPVLRNAALQRVFRTWAQQDPFAASAALVEVAGADRANLGELVGREFAQRAPAEALRWAADAGWPAHRVVVTEVARRDPQLALDSASALAAEQRRLAVPLVLATVAERDAVAAAGYWQQIPADTRAESAAAIVSRWQRQDPAAAADWLLGLPSGADRDTAAGRFVATAANDNRDVPRLLNAMSSAETRSQYATERIRRLVADNAIAQAESELALIDLPAAARREASAIIDAAAR